MKVINYLGIGFAIGIVLQVFFALKYGNGFNNEVLNTLWLSFLAGLIGFLAVNIYAIVNTSGATLAATTDEMRNGFFYSMITVGILLSLQAVLTLNGSAAVFIPVWLKWLIYIGVGVGFVAWIICAAFFGLAYGIDKFRGWVTTNYRWLIVGGILAGVVGLIVTLSDTSLAFSKDDALFKFKKVAPTSSTTDNAAQLEEDELAELTTRYKTNKGTNAEKIADIKEMLRLAKKYDDGTNAKKIADLERMITLLEKYEGTGEPLAGNSAGAGKQPAEAEEYKKAEQSIRDGNGNELTQKRNADGSVEQHINANDAGEPDAD